MFWCVWLDCNVVEGLYCDVIECVLIMVKLLLSLCIGGIVVVLISLLFECFGGKCNWDYWFCWLCDVSFMLCVLVCCGYCDEVVCWCDWFVCVIVDYLL